MFSILLQQCFWDATETQRCIFKEAWRQTWLHVRLHQGVRSCPAERTHSQCWSVVVCRMFASVIFLLLNAFKLVTEVGGFLALTAVISSGAWFVLTRELKQQTFLVPRTPTGSIFATWQPLRMSRRSWAAVTDFKARVFRLKPEVQILGYSKSIRHTKVEILRLKSCFLRKKETKLNANLWKAFSTELSCRRSWWFHVVLLNALHLARKPRPRSSSARSAMPFVNQERLIRFNHRELEVPYN